MIGRVTVRSLGLLSKNQSSLRVCLARGFAAQNFDNIKLVHHSQVNCFDYNEAVNALVGATTWEDLANILTVANSVVTDMFFAYAIEKFAKYRVDRDQHFTEVVLPYAISFVKKCSMNQSISFAFVATAMGDMGVKDEALWAGVKEKLLNQNFSRYIPLNTLGPLIRAMAHVGQADPAVLKALGGQVLKHQKGLSDSHKNAAIHGFETAGIGAEVFRKALEQGADHHELRKTDQPKKLH